MLKQCYVKLQSFLLRTSYKSMFTDATLPGHSQLSKWVRNVLSDSGGAAEIHSSVRLIMSIHEKSCLHFVISCLVDSVNMWKKVLWSDYITLKLLTNYYIWQKTMIPHHPKCIIIVKHGGGSIRLQECFSLVETLNLQC